MPSPQQTVYVDRSRDDSRREKEQEKAERSQERERNKDKDKHREKEKEKEKEKPTPSSLFPTDADSFLSLMADILRLQEETLTMAFVYINRYHRHISTTDSSEADADLLDAHTLSLASLSLATKATESPRRLREFLIPAHTLLHPLAPPLSFPSPLYDSLRSTLVAAELILLRVLKFELRVTLPYEFLPRLLEKVLTTRGIDYDSLSLAELEESRIVEVRDTSIGREVWRLVDRAMRRRRICNFFPARVVAVACLWVVVEGRGCGVRGSPEEWVEWVTSGRVEAVDFWEAVEEVRGVA
ncbi:hypothetical protein RUND412_005604 [Rhizina undulata]